MTSNIEDFFLSGRCVLKGFHGLSNSPAFQSFNPGRIWSGSSTLALKMELSGWNIRVAADSVRVCPQVKGNSGVFSIDRIHVRPLPTAIYFSRKTKDGAVTKDPQFEFSLFSRLRFRV